MKTALLHVVNAIENVPEGTKVPELVAFCEKHGLPKQVVACLVYIPGDTDPGRLNMALNALESKRSLKAFLKTYAPTKETVGKKTGKKTAAKKKAVKKAGA